ncbi:hypothetical protein GGR56DRAFT_120707 [Xylariaceae sp. FL0804]|nr:hypothetical protein GGR56DRAFT_120707 [Xylariaceae sp. FL0804]
MLTGRSTKRHWCTSESNVSRGRSPLTPTPGDWASGTSTRLRCCGSLRSTGRKFRGNWILSPSPVTWLWLATNKVGSLDGNKPHDDVSLCIGGAAKLASISKPMVSTELISKRSIGVDNQRLKHFTVVSGEHNVSDFALPLARYGTPAGILHVSG